MRGWDRPSLVVCLACLAATMLSGCATTHPSRRGSDKPSDRVATKVTAVDTRFPTGVSPKAPECRRPTLGAGVDPAPPEGPPALVTVRDLKGRARGLADSPASVAASPRPVRRGQAHAPGLSRRPIEPAGQVRGGPPPKPLGGGIGAKSVLGAAPANDFCEDAKLIAVPSIAVEGSTLDAGVDPAPSCGAAWAPTAPGLWYKVIGTGNFITASTCEQGTDFNTQLSVFCAGCSNLLCVAGNNDASACDLSPVHSTVGWCSEQGTEYLILVHGFADSAGSFYLTLSEGEPCLDPPDCDVAPPHDECGDCIWVATNQPFSGSTVGATGTDITSCALRDTADVWHCWRADCTGAATFSLCNSSFDTSLAIFNDCGGNELACDDNGCGDTLQSELTYNVVAGSTYYIRVAGTGGATGDYLLNVTCEPPTGACCDNGTGICEDGTAEDDCPPPLRFAADTLCADLYPPCAGPPLGACCVGGQCVATTPEADCLQEDGMWFEDEVCPDFACPQPPVCPDNTLYAQPAPLQLWAAGASDTDWWSGALVRYENFAGVDPPICDVHWWGLNMFWNGQQFLECTENPMVFVIRFYEPGMAAPGPGNEVCAYTVTVTGVPTGLLFAGREMIEYHVDLPWCCVLGSGWISIQGTLGPDCWFFWVSSEIGDGASCVSDGINMRCGEPDFSDIDLSVCLTAATVPIGACCVDGQCVGVMSEPACQQRSGTWYEGETCATVICPPVPCEESPHPDCVGDCPSGMVCAPVPGAIACACESIPCEQSPFPECLGGCSPDWACRADQANGFCFCEPVDCRPNDEGTDCLDVVCSDIQNECLPEFIQVTLSGPAPSYAIVGCECQSPDKCHVMIDPPNNVDCDGGCPPGKRCELIATPIGPHDTEYECRCVAEQLMACCMPDGACSDQTPFDCEQLGGFPQEAGTACEGDPNLNGMDDACEDEPCAHCGPGFHWVDTCPGGPDNMPSGAKVGIDTDSDCVADTNLVLDGPVYIRRTAAMDDSLNYPGTRPIDGHLDVLDTEIISLSLTDGSVTLTAGAGLGQGGVLPSSLGTIAELPSNAAWAESFFDVFVEMEMVGGGHVYNHDPLPVMTLIDCLPPNRSYIHPVGCTPLYLTPPGADPGQPVANLVSAIHSTYPECGDPATGDCFTIHDTPYCNDRECCLKVCGQINGCCSIAWGPPCVDLANQMCLERPIEVDQFDFSIGQFELTGGPFGAAGETIEVSGSTTVHVFFEGPTEGSAADDDGDLRDEVETQMVDLNLNGFSSLGPVHVTVHPTQPSMGEIEETADFSTGLLDLPPFAPAGTADSFFDIYFQVDVGELTFFTKEPKRMSTVITHKPPGPGALYENLRDIELYDESGEPTGVFLGATRHRPRPPIEIDQFDFSIGQFELTGGPFGTDGEIIEVSGSTTVHVFFEGSTEGSADDDDGNLRDEVETQMVDLNLNGLTSEGVPVHVTVHPTEPSMGGIEETADFSTGLLDLPPFAPAGTADSFFDIYFQVEVGELTYFTFEPKHMSSVITHKPPAPGNLYENLRDVELYDENGEPTGVFLGATRHRPRAPVEVDQFDFSIGQFELTGGPFGTDGEIIEVSGSTTVHVFFEGATEGLADDDDRDLRDEVVTQMVELNLNGMTSQGVPVHVTVHPTLPSMGEIEETTDFSTGLLDLPPFAAAGTADSFFDIYFQVEVGGETYFTFEAKHMSSVITHKPPAPGDLYEDLQDIELYDENGEPTGVFLGATRHRPRPPTEIDQFDFSIGELEISGPFGTEVLDVTGPATVAVYFEGDAEGLAGDDDNDGHDEVQTEMVDLNLTGSSPSLGLVQVTLNPNRPSFGEIEEQANPTPGLLDLPPFTSSGTADSFFDIYFQVEVAGQRFFTIDPKHMSSVITHKPPGPTDLYENLTRVRLYDADGNPTEYYLDATRHRPRPPVEIDEFDFSIGELEVSGPMGTEVIAVSGPARVAVYFEGSTEGSAIDDDGNGRDEVHTEMIELNLTGLSPNFGPIHISLNPSIASMGAIEETADLTTGVLDLPPFGPPDTTADSFFDIYFQVEVGGQLFYTIQPKRMSALITHKPPGPTDLYENLQDIQLYDAAGNATGFFLSATRHRPHPPVEIDEFDFSIGEVEISGPMGTEIITVSGPTRVAVYFEGHTEGEADDDDGDGRDEVRTEMIDLNLTGFSPTFGPVHIGLNPHIVSFGEIEERINLVTGTLDLPPFGPPDTVADSFFNIYFQVEVGGQTFYTIAPKHMRTVITHKPPGPTDVYENTEAVELVNEFGQPTGFFLSATRHQPQPPVEIDEFDFSIGEVEIFTPFGVEIIPLMGPTTVAVYFEGTTEGMANDNDGDQRDEVRTEMIELNLTGFSPTLGPVRVGLNPHITSFGEIEESADVVTGTLDLPPFGPADTTADSFFDIYFQVDVGGSTFYTVEPKHMSSVITYKPPAPGNLYENAEPIELVNAFGQSTGFFLSATRHQPRPPCHAGDVDGDQDVDLTDARAFLSCLTSPVGSPASAECARCFDFDNDGDVDLADFRVFQAAFTGAH